MTERIDIDEMWLKANYKTKSIKAIATELGCSRAVVRRNLDCHGIPRRRHAEAVSLAGLSNKEAFPYLRNGEWLKEQYYAHLKSLNDIAIELEISDTAVLRAFNGFGIARRSLSEANALKQRNNVELTQRLLEIIEGELMGDGHLRSWGGYSASYCHTSKHKQYLEWLSSVLHEHGVHQSGKLVTSRTGCSVTYVYHSLSYFELMSVRDRWYPNGVKRFPDDLILSPVMVRQWYLGDGSLLHKKKGRGTAVIAVCSRDDKEVDVIRDAFHYALGVTPGFWRSNRLLAFGKSSVSIFFDYIGKCPDEITDIYGYKWPS